MVGFKVLHCPDRCEVFRTGSMCVPPQVFFFIKMLYEKKVVTRTCAVMCIALINFFFSFSLFFLFFFSLSLLSCVSVQKEGRNEKGRNDYL